MYKNLAYYHGLESSNVGDKVDWMKENFTKVYSPKIDYNSIDFKEEVRKMKALKINCIVGSSIGGYFAYWLSRYVKVNLIIFNPAIPYRTSGIEPIPEEYKIQKDIGSDVTIILGTEDNIIKSSDTLEWLKEFDTKSKVEEISGMGHRTSFEIFKEKVSKLL